MNETPDTRGLDFVRTRVAEDVAAGRWGGRVVTRFPPEPNGYLHLGHAKSICLNFGLAAEYGSYCHLRFDDTNPLKESQEYVDAILADVQWLGFDPGAHVHWAADYFERLYAHAQDLIRRGAAYVCSLSADEMAKLRGTLTTPGVESPYRSRSADESLDLLARMRAGEFADGTHTLRARIDMASGNLNMRDPVLYRIRRAHHHRAGDAWCIYPTYDYAHPLSDAIEGITHSLCTLEFEDHRPFYDWLLRTLEIPEPPQQIEFARLDVTRTVLSKRKLLQLVTEGHVDGWDDPRMPTIAGMRRRGFPPAALRDFADRIGVSRSLGRVDIQLLHHCVREDLNRTAQRAMAVLDPVKLVIEDWPAERIEWVSVENNPEDPTAGSRLVPFGRELWVERDDVKEEAPSKWFRLAPGREVRLKGAWYVTLSEIVKDAAGNIVELRCSHDPASSGGETPDGRRVKGTLHWVSAAHAVDAEVRLYDHLFAVDEPEHVPEGGSFLDHLNPESLQVLSGCKLEPALADAPSGSTWQFLRTGYFAADPRDHQPGARAVFHRVLGLRDTWAKVETKG
jgi:glutaminyl-tRNA synthetase